ncbi:hypothetical protein NAEGRDRAFT_79625 [Naegleria gruberi]|uniref:Uncharacterized protein n=1 Tax=Naegleria gruberi TaxID=5762 RepID=D2VE84_NAEGR|nr:uncharacterized protein NAEGRDRAFT_79625 [Naegleria gruberi]EFC44752.1 hypothetical protein NAEGRDRAFT_79625 [Naegleria gruberi]|eukprot:XP_002677496.1 hypothetical protein NAEGRDRAFT_79625 [Naegleria gruberi strain NEG-M]
MGDMIFDQLEDLGNDTFSEFEPVGFNTSSISINCGSSNGAPSSPYYYGSDYISNGSVEAEDSSMMMAFDGATTNNNGNSASGSNSLSSSYNSSGMMMPYHTAPPSPSNYSHDGSYQNMPSEYNSMMDHHGYSDSNYSNNQSMNSSAHHHQYQQHYQQQQQNSYRHSDIVYNNNESFEFVERKQTLPSISGQYHPSTVPMGQLPPNVLGDLLVKNVFIQDHTGKNLDSTSISNCILKCQSGFFGMVFEDSFYGPSISQFYPSDIVTVVRQCDRIGVYVQFRRFLTCKNVAMDGLKSRFPSLQDYQWANYADEHTWTDSRAQFYKDSPLSTCLYLMIEFYNDNQIQYLFHYFENSIRLLECLKMVYPQWMFCAHFCTSNDVQLICLAVQNKQFSKEIDNYVSVQASESSVHDQTVESSILPDLNEKQEPISSRTGFTAKWAKKANSNVQVGVLTTMKQYHFKNKNTKSSSSRNRRSMIDFKKIELVVPPNFYNMALEVRKFCEELLVGGRILPYQLSVGLCSTLAIAQTDQAKVRAQQVLKSLSKHPNVQLKNMSAIARFILSSNEKSTPNLKEQTKIPSSNSSTTLVTSSSSSSLIEHTPQRKKSISNYDETLNLFSKLRLTNNEQSEYGKNSSSSSASSQVTRRNSSASSNGLKNAERDGCIIS